MNPTVLLILSLALFGGAFAAPRPTRTLDDDTARLTLGGTCFQGRRCIRVADCDSYNLAIGTTSGCPLPTGYSNCYTCTNGNADINNCVVGGALECKSIPGGIDCGLIEVGHCTGTTCVFSWETDESCTDGLNCQVGC